MFTHLWASVRSVLSPAPRRRRPRQQPRRLTFELLEDRSSLSATTVVPRHHVAGDVVHAFQQTNIVSDIPGRAAATDPRLVNPWGLSQDSMTGFFRVSDNGAGLATLYDVRGHSHPTAVTIPLPSGRTGKAAPTGNVHNTTPDFVISENGRSASARILFATEDGTIAAWNPKVDRNHAVIAADNSACGAV